MGGCSACEVFARMHGRNFFHALTLPPENVGPPPTPAPPHKGEGGKRCDASATSSNTQRRHDRDHRGFARSEDVGVRNAENTKALRVGPCILDAVAFRHGGQVMNAAIDFYHETLSRLREVEDVAAKWRLSAKMTTFNFAQQFPEAPLRRRHLVTQALRACVGVWKVSLPVRHLNCPPPLPLPTRGRGSPLVDRRRYRPSSAQIKRSSGA